MVYLFLSVAGNYGELELKESKSGERRETEAGCVLIRSLRNNRIISERVNGASNGEITATRHRLFLARSWGLSWVCCVRTCYVYAACS